MLSAVTVISIVMVIVTWPCGTILNLSIIAVYVSDWKKGVKLGESDQLSLLMGCNNLLFQCFITILEAFYLYGHCLSIEEKLCFVVSAALIFSISLSFWLTAGLSICYCLRLVNISLKFFIQLKSRLSHTVTPFLLGSLAISFIITLSSANWISYSKGHENITDIYHNNMSIADLSCRIIAVTVGNCLPSLITSICILLSLISLLRHIWRMKQNTQFGSPQLKNLIKACRTMFLLMALNFLFFLIISGSAITQNSMETIWNMIFLLGELSNPSCQAIVLIFGNSKLLSAWTKTVFPQSQHH
ncbi:taste receptor type 2 member 40 [Xenopus laevis]|uniref:Taste receptor type 2 n=1 Tax=Xenopus laevis TaxID=8355 RepID=A0A8J0TYA4_XENLA|nr:taste receptor type 2 member 40 [Xenopus laevis]